MFGSPTSEWPLREAPLPADPCRPPARAERAAFPGLPAPPALPGRRRRRLNVNMLKRRNFEFGRNGGVLNLEF